MRSSLAVAIVAALAFLGWQHGRASEPDGRAELLSVYKWQIPSEWFGGYSALKLSPDGNELLAVSDRGHFIQARIERDQDVVIGIADPIVHRIVNRTGKFERKTKFRDSEGLAIKPNGQLVVSFEGDHRVKAFRVPGAKPQLMPWSSGLDTMASNGGFEAIAYDPQGRLYAFPEQPIGPTQRLHVFRMEDDVWKQPIVLLRDKEFQPVGADFGPDGRLYLLERGFNGVGFRNRVRSFAITTTGFSDEKLLFRKGIGGHDNLEGLSVWQDAQGRIRLTMISDDNFRFLQRTEIVEYVIQ